MYYIVYGFFYVFSLLPWRFFYLLSDGISFLLFAVFKYRREVVLQNLAIAFPEKTKEEHLKIAKQFYRDFTDHFLESIKLISISKKELNKRFQCDYSPMNDLYDSGLNITLLSGHFFNFEFANTAYAINMRYPFVGVYMPLSNKIFDQLFYTIRTRFDTNLVAATHFKKEFSVYAKGRYVLGLIGDQNPGNPGNSYWTNFFGRMTCFVKGPEKGARYNKNAVILCYIFKTQRGYYQSKLKVLTTDPSTLPEGEITKQMVAFFEESIRKNPSNYLWSHRRWKWQYDENKHQHLVIK